MWCAIAFDRRNEAPRFLGGSPNKIALSPLAAMRRRCDREIVTVTGAMVLAALILLQASTQDLKELTPLKVASCCQATAAAGVRRRQPRIVIPVR